MKDTPIVIYNGACPICSREIGLYRARAGAGGPRFLNLAEADLAPYGLTPDAAARRLHVVQNGTLLSGFDAFVALWRATPGFGWLARLVGLPGISGLVRLVYDRAAAPLLYAMHRRRQARR